MARADSRPAVLAGTLRASRSGCRSATTLERTIMLADSIEYTNVHEANAVLDDGIARYCAFRGYTHEGAHIGATFVACTFEHIDWYWALFNCAVFVDCRFTHCTFRGATFATSRFVSCTFEKCAFLADNLGGSCRNEASRVYDCTAKECSNGEFLFECGAL